MNDLSMIVSIASGCFVIIGGLYAFFRWASSTSHRVPSAPSQPSPKDSTIWEEYVAPMLFVLAIALIFISGFGALAGHNTMTIGIAGVILFIIAVVIFLANS